MMHLQAGKRSLLHQGLFRLAAKGLNTLPSSEEACSKEGIDWNKVLLQTRWCACSKDCRLISKDKHARASKTVCPCHLFGILFQRPREKYKIFSKIDATSKRAASRLCRNRDHVLLCGLEQVQEILVYLIQNSTWDLAVSCGVGSFHSIISLLLSVQMLDNAGFCCPHLVTCHS